MLRSRTCLFRLLGTAFGMPSLIVSFLSDSFFKLCLATIGCKGNLAEFIYLTVGLRQDQFKAQSIMRCTVIPQKEEDGGYVVTVPVLPGCVSQGDTRQEALRNIEEAIELYVEDMRAAGEPVPVEDERTYVEINTLVR
jgi:predicted RNase H-like HicB family nuclease